MIDAGHAGRASRVMAACLLAASTTSAGREQRLKRILHGITLQEEELNLTNPLRTLLRYWWLVLLGPIIGALAGFLYSNAQPRVYSSSTKIVVQQSSGSGVSAANPDFDLSENLAQTYSEMIIVDPVVEEVSQQLGGGVGPDQVNSSLSVDVSNRILTITAASANPQDAANIANTTAEVFINRTEQNMLAQLSQLQAAAEAAGLGDINSFVAAQVSAQGSLFQIEPAKPILQPVEPQPRQTAITAGILGALVASLGALGLGFVRDPLPSLEELERRFDVVGLGVIWQMGHTDVGNARSRLLDRPNHLAVEMFRNVLTNLRFATSTRGAKVIVVSSPRASEGKSTVVGHVALTAALAGLKVTIIEADLRRPGLETVLGEREEGPGVSEFLANDLLPAPILQDISVPGSSGSLQVVFAGTVPPNPAELLGTARFKDMVDFASEQSDLVLIDSPPVLAVADTLILARNADTMILVADTASTKTRHLREAIMSARRVEANVSGLVLNKVRRQILGYGYGYGSGYGYGYGYGDGSGYGQSANGHNPGGIGKRVGSRVARLLGK
ncbi:MAG: polysaccharide biosynthesis tyrosine autokinase [Chloroflexota bacterium]